MPFVILTVLSSGEGQGWPGILGLVYSVCLFDYLFVAPPPPPNRSRSVSVPDAEARKKVKSQSQADMVH